MSTYDDFLTNAKRVEMEINLGICKVRLDGKLVCTHKYVSGDMEDKLGATIRAYRDLTQALLKSAVEAADAE